MRASSLSFIWLTCLPFSRYEPLLGVSRQPIRFINVDLPEPDGPMMATYSLRSMRRSTPRSACTCSAPMSYVFHKSSVQIMHEDGGATSGASARLAVCVAIFSSDDKGPFLAIRTLDGLVHEMFRKNRPLTTS